MRIVDIDNGIIYETVTEAARKFNINDKSTLYTHLRGKTKTCSGHRFAWIDADNNIVDNDERNKSDSTSSILKWMVKINTAFNFGQWGHWISLKGLKMIFDVPDGEKKTFTKVLRLNFGIMRSTRSGSFSPCQGFSGLFFYTPLFKQQYWQKIVEIKKQVPVIIDIEKRGPEKQIEHGYEMLTHSKLIPTADEYRQFKDDVIAQKIFDFDAVKPVTCDEFLKQNNKRKYRKNHKA